MRTSSDTGVIDSKATSGGIMFEYLLEKYRTVGSGRAFLTQKRRTSRDSVTAQSYKTKAASDEVRYLVLELL